MSDNLSSKTQPRYTAKDIYVLKGLEPVRRRPGMYIGSTGEAGLHHLIWEVVDNSFDEAISGHATHVYIVLQNNHRVTVIDNGRGIPTDEHPVTKKSALETVMTTLHAGGKFGGESYKIAGGLHGVGVSVVCALSEWLRATVKRDGRVWLQEYSRGKPLKPVEDIGSVEEQDGYPGDLDSLKRFIPSFNTGTIITFDPDPKIFAVNGEMPDFSWKALCDHLRQQTYLIPGLRVSIFDVRSSVKEPRPLGRVRAFQFDGGIKSYVRWLNNGEKVAHGDVFFCSRQQDEIIVDAALQYRQDVETKEYSFVNNIFTPEGGMHVTGLRKALTRVLNDFARHNELVSKDQENFSGDDVREGLTVVLSIKIREPQFEGQTKAKLGNPEARGAVESVVASELSAWLEQHPEDARLIIARVTLAQKARQAARAAKETVLRKGVLEGLALPGKLADCSSRDPANSELFIVEGDSAGGSMKQARDRNTQAVLPLRGKILNVERARLAKALSFKEIKALIIALGTAIAEEFDIAKLRYHKVIIATDADVDGGHIRVLLLTLFYRYLKPIIEDGYLFIANPPLYKITAGRKFQYAYSDEELKKATEELRKNGAKNIDIQRYKGLGEMNPDQLWETTMNPEKRILKQVNIEDAEYADKLFSILMGSEVLPRKKFIQAHAQEVQNLDV